MIQVKEFVDSDTRLAEKSANEFLAGLSEDQVINICYSSMLKSNFNQPDSQRGSILIVYRVNK